MQYLKEKIQILMLTIENLRIYLNILKSIYIKTFLNL